MANEVFDNETYERQLAVVMLEALEKQGIISISSKYDLINEIGGEDEIWHKAVS